VAYAQLGRWKEAIEPLKEAIRLKPGYPEAHYNLGVTCLMLADRGRALDEYKVLKDLDKDKAAKLFNLIYPN